MGQVDQPRAEVPERTGTQPGDLRLRDAEPPAGLGPRRAAGKNSHHYLLPCGEYEVIAGTVLTARAGVQGEAAWCRGDWLVHCRRGR
jgi:hypothetical protein